MFIILVAFNIRGVQFCCYSRPNIALSLRNYAIHFSIEA